MSSCQETTNICCKRVFLSCSLVGFVLLGSLVFNCCSDWFLLQGEKIRSEKVVMVSTFSQRIIRYEFSYRHFCAYFSRIRGEKFASHEKFVSCKSGFRFAVFLIFASRSQPGLGNFPKRKQDYSQELLKFSVIAMVKVQMKFRVLLKIVRGGKTKIVRHFIYKYKEARKS